MNRKRDYIFILLTALAVFSVCLFLTAKNSGGTENNGIEIVVHDTSEKPEKENSVVHTEKTKHTEAAETEEKHVTEATEELLMLDINKASVTELTKLDGIGEKLAERIAVYRESNGGFRNIEEIMLVNGIGEEKFEAIREHIYVENPVYPAEEVTEKESISEEITDPPASEVSVPETEVSEEETEKVSEITETQINLENASPIDLNTATAEELMLLPYVDEETAEAIIELREKLNGFRNTYELLYVEELEQKEVAEIVNFVTIGQ